MSDKYMSRKSEFLYGDQAVTTRNVVMVVHCPGYGTLDIWMPRALTDTFTREMRESLIEAITDFLRNVPVRRN